MQRAIYLFLTFLLFFFFFSAGYHKNGLGRNELNEWIASRS